MKVFYGNYKLGIVGGGQLGRMLIQSAIDLNIDVHVLDPAPDAPCQAIAHQFTRGSLTDFDTVYQFGKACDLVTIEIENVNTEALKRLRDEGVTVYPQPEIIELVQDKVVQKRFYKEHNIPTSPFYEVANRQEVLNHADFIPMVNKLAREGYDGRGVQLIRKPEELSMAFDKPGLIEKLIDFDREISVIVARNAKGEIASFPAVELSFHPTANLVEFLFAPADISEKIATEAKRIAEDVINKLNMTGLLAVEMFVTKQGEVLVNEIAPRPHNSGHQSIEANMTSQYEQHLRAILNMPLGSTKALIPSAMVNLLGEEGYSGEVRCDGIEEVLRTEGVHIHLYGKKETKPFRKMGHVTITDPDPEQLKIKARFVKDTLKIKSND
ncbi:MAG: 5-(carboxyamino)imidazole ribonucleotide synthase [Cyclobacteriaceae bacterium]|nr:5-(carboxyamino)imidazole ribonucleotide synthase [Cyclobacteriaceae bacterium]